MATEKQYEFFNQRYAEETERQRDLLKKSQLYFSVITLVSSILFANIQTFKDFVKDYTPLAITSSILLVTIAAILVCLFCSIRIKDYFQAIDTQEYLDNLPEEEEEDNEFFDNRIADFIAAVDKNRAVNDEKADWLKYSEYAILFFILLILIITLQILFK